MKVKKKSGKAIPNVMTNRFLRIEVLATDKYCCNDDGDAELLRCQFLMDRLDRVGTVYVASSRCALFSGSLRLHRGKPVRLQDCHASELADMQTDGVRRTA